MSCTEKECPLPTECRRAFEDGIATGLVRASNERLDKGGVIVYPGEEKEIFTNNMCDYCLVPLSDDAHMNKKRICEPTFNCWFQGRRLKAGAV